MLFEISLSEDAKSHVYAVVNGMQSSEKQRLPSIQIFITVQFQLNRRITACLGPPFACISPPPPTSVIRKPENTLQPSDARYSFSIWTFIKGSIEGIRQYKLVLSRILVILLILQNRKTPRCSSTEIYVTLNKLCCIISGENKVSCETPKAS